MSTISAQQVQELREKTGLPLMQVKKALVETGGDAEKAIQYLKELGLTSAANKSARTTHEGTIGTYLHSNKKLFAGVSLLCESDFVARSDVFQDAAHKLAMHVAAAAPTYVSRDEVPADIIDGERTTMEKQLANEGKPKELWDKIVPGKLEKFYEDNCLMDQVYALDGEVRISTMLTELVQKLGENIKVGAIYRWTI